MKIKGIKIDNFKSFGNSYNILRFDSENTIALIGKNESGKSNTLLAIKDISFFDPLMKKTIFKDKNRLVNAEVEISVDIEFENKDIPTKYKKYVNSYISNFKFSMKNNSLYMNFNGCLCDILANDNRLVELSQLINNFTAKNQINEVKIFKEKINNFTTTFVPLINIDSIFYMSNEQKTQYNEFKEILEEYYRTFREILPKIIYFSNDMVLKNKYTYDNIIKKEDLMGLEMLLNALEFNLEDLKKWLSSSDVATKQKYRTIFEKALNKFNKKFQQYYKTNSITLLCNVDTKTIEFSVKDDLEKDGTSITSFSERSDGLKWYISMFSQLYSSMKKYKYSLILLDEPGNSLHVLAQKKLLELLMVTNNFQIIYTTHSPYMIDIEHLENIRLITKNKYTCITNGINNLKNREQKSFKETLTPILEAIGTSLNYNFGPSPFQENLIVEGITDYYYIKAMINYLQVDNKKIPNIIPSIGATNECHIASIMIGWGYKFKCLFDNDKEGMDSLKKIKKSLDINDELLFLVSDNHNETIENLLSNEIINKLNCNSKLLRAKLFSSLLLKKEIDIDEETKNNFENLFKKIGILSDKMSYK